MPRKKTTRNHNQRGKTIFVRRNSFKPERSRILIVCEDSKHSVHYFTDLRNDLGLNATNVQIKGKECKSQPSKVYEYAQKELNNDIEVNGDDNSYDVIYCVFDKDEHKDFDQVLEKIKKTRKFEAIYSIPCFEFWVLLHFTLTTKQFSKYKELEKEIKKNFNGYNKVNSKNLYHSLKDKLQTAIKNSKKILSMGPMPNPVTYIHVLVEKLIDESHR